jgi:hypothetical protein
MARGDRLKSSRAVDAQSGVTSCYRNGAITVLYRYLGCVIRLRDRLVFWHEQITVFAGIEAGCWRRPERASESISTMPYKSSHTSSFSFVIFPLVCAIHLFALQMPRSAQNLPLAKTSGPPLAKPSVRKSFRAGSAYREIYLPISCTSFQVCAVARFR